VHENPISKAIIGAAIEVHSHLGPGLLESAYEACLYRELRLREFGCERQKPLSLDYKGEKLEAVYRLDLVVAGKVIVEVKAVEQLLPIIRPNSSPTSALLACASVCSLTSVSRSSIEE
jgi:GxxExxY protein